MIEKGRHRDLERNMRICPFCTSVEDEIHFLTKCDAFRYVRADLLFKVGETLNNRSIRIYFYKQPKF